MALNRQQGLLGILAALSAVAVYTYWPAGGGRAPAAPTAPAGQRAAAAAPASAAVPDVRLEALGDERPTPSAGERNLFRFKPKPAPPPPPARAPVMVAAPPPIVPSGPPPPPPLPPIPLKFIGLLQTGPSERIAILSDGRGAPIYGKEGETVLGQYKIVRIGPESIDMSYLDGRGRQSIRLSGS